MTLYYKNIDEIAKTVKFHQVKNPDGEIATCAVVENLDDFPSKLPYFVHEIAHTELVDHADFFMERSDALHENQGELTLKHVQKMQTDDYTLRLSTLQSLQDWAQLQQEIDDGQARALAIEKERERQLELAEAGIASEGVRG